jgi:hypothetical protein
MIRRIEPRKHLFARPDSLLIDDYHENVKRFKVHGGHGIFVPRPCNEHWALDPAAIWKKNWRQQFRNSRDLRSIDCLQAF